MAHYRSFSTYPGSTGSVSTNKPDKPAKQSNGTRTDEKKAYAKAKAKKVK